MPKVSSRAKLISMRRRAHEERTAFHAMVRLTAFAAIPALSALQRSLSTWREQRLLHLVLARPTRSPRIHRGRSAQADCGRPPRYPFRFRSTCSRPFVLQHTSSAFATLNVSAFANASSSRFAEAFHTTTQSPSVIFPPRISVSFSAVLIESRSRPRRPSRMLKKASPMRSTNGLGSV
jgi:hypothetical protein